MLQSYNPYTGSFIKEYSLLTSEEIRQKLADADKAFVQYKKTSFEERAELISSLSLLLVEKKESLAQLVTEEMGKRYVESLAEIEKCSLVCNYYAKHASLHLRDEKLLTDNSESYLVFQPLGCVLAVMPWNFPFWQVFRFLVPALMSGNVGVLKHASNVSGCALAIEQLCVEAGFDRGVFQTLLISSNQVEEVINSKEIKAVTLTGSEQAGSIVASHAGKAIKKTVLELGGSDPFIVLEDADLEYVTEMALKSRFLNCGQSCIAAKRFIIPKKIRNKFLGLLTEKVEGLTLGDPSEVSTDIGPMARLDLLLELDRQVDQSVMMGAVVVTGGAIQDEKRCLYLPTILADVQKGMEAYDSELFGPVMSVIYYETVEDAISIANDTPYGLGASIWTSDIEKGKNIAKDIDSGAVFINEMVKSDPRLPFGGVKMSGYGRELSVQGIREFVNQKTIVVK